MTRLRIVLLAALALVVSLPGCGRPAQPGGDTERTEETQSAVDTGPTAQTHFTSPLAQTSPLPTPTPTPLPPTPFPPPAPDKGSITGQLIHFQTGEPLANTPIFLGQLSPLTTAEGLTHTITVLPASSPHTMTDEQGYFSLLDVEPDTYALVIWTPVTSWVISDPDTQHEILVTVKAGEITDLGQVVSLAPT